ncbi:MAG: AraC family transcriptional regulator [Eubacterium sp.]|nr:AraC family transcriptional regulator [Eubacterium sp.]
MNDNLISGVLKSKGFGSNVQSVAESDDVHVLRIQSPTGEGYMTLYMVMKGVYVMFDEFHLDSCESEFKNMESVFCIDHCRQGRIEHENLLGNKFYMESGDLKLGRRINHSGRIHMPNGYYYGMTIGFEIGAAENSIKTELSGIDIDIGAIVEKFSSHDMFDSSDKSIFSDKEYFIRRDSLLKNDEYIEHVLSEMYNIPKEIRMELFKVKIMELLLRLKMLDKTLYKDDRIYIPASQAEKIKEVHKLIIDSPGKNYTVEDLSQMFGIPESTLRKNFREIYGSPIYKYIKKFKINKAAELLKNDSSLKVSDVAESVGYDNPSKFAAAFKDVMGMNPMDFRNI